MPRRREGVPNRFRPFFPFFLTLLVVNAALAAGGAVYAARKGVPAEAAVPVIAAFLLQATVYLVPGFPRVRAWVQNHFPPWMLAHSLMAVSLAPYLVYSLPAGVFREEALLRLFLLLAVPVYLFLWFPVRAHVLSWQDVTVMAVLAYPMISGLSPLFREVYVSPHPAIPSLHVLGKLMLIPVGAMAFLCLRRLEGTGFQLAVSRRNFWIGVKNFLLFLLLGLPLALGLGFVRFSPRPIEDWTYVFGLAGTLLGVYAAVSLSEELFFRGILQNLAAPALGSAPAAQLLAAVAFGLVHLPRGFPNWRYACVAALAGWFYGRAYREAGSVVAAAVTHTLVVAAWRYLFR